MAKTSEVIKKGVLVTVATLALLVIAFLLYFLLFRLMETISPGAYRFVRNLRVGYGVAWLMAALLLYRTKIADWLKAALLAAGLGAFVIAVGVQLYETPAVAVIITVICFGAAVYLLYRMKKKWYHYYALLLAGLGLLFYL